MSLLLLFDKGDAPCGEANLYSTEELELTRELVLVAMNEFGYAHSGDESDLEINLHDDELGPWASVHDSGDTDLRIIMWIGDNVQIVDGFTEIKVPQEEVDDGSS